MSGNLLYFEVAQEIENKINAGIYEEGEKLPSERELTQAHNVSRNVIRQALTILREKGLITIKPGKGAYITKIKDTLVTETLKRVIGKYDSSIEDIQEVRYELETLVIKLAVKKACSDNIEELKSICNQMDKDISISSFLDLDLKFHKTLASSTQNPIFSVLVNSFFDMTEHTTFLLTNYTNSFINVMDKAQEHHWMLIKSIESRDVDRAILVMQDHMNLFGEEISLLKSDKVI
ncbi:FadR family transcriptional regulator [Peribacillus butanolivorans]|uniref:FadR/GntR family transcriptional regulator n=1 Tax=Peribacillus butanolivorans TaxID=421767 RepID=UPI00207D7112|nr:FadR/GntR family transcriptional regulator [Peribacillus butanolivorans]MCO0600607.1 FadR family transcriptional regulator [Peribacillus butanolivorans]